MAKVLIITGDFVEDYENMVVFQALQAMGHQVDAVCPDKNSGDQIATAVHDFENHQTYLEKPGHNFTLNATFDEVQVDHYDALYLPGGRAPEYLRLNQRVLEIIQQFAKHNKCIAAICHGAQLLTAAGIIKGRKISAYPACQPEVELAGAFYANIKVEEAITDGNIVSAPAWPALPEFIKQFNELL